MKSKINHSYKTGLLQGTAYSRLHSTISIALFPFDLSIPEWKTLGQVHDSGRRKLSDLPILLDYDPPMVTKMIKQLEKKGLIKRTPDENDERAKIITITSAGNNIISKIEPEIKKSMRNTLNGITPEELSIYIKVLNTIVKNTNK